MIAIVNVSKRLRPKGKHKYEVRINKEVIATFEHDREDKLYTCLQKAADAVYDEIVIKPAIRLSDELIKKESKKLRNTR